MRSLEIPNPQERDWRYRFFEMLPGLLSWSVLAAPFILAALDITLAAYFITLYIGLWVIRSITIAFRTLQGWGRVDEQRRLDWQALNHDLESLKLSYKRAPAWHQANLRRVEERMLHRRLMPSQVIHAIFFTIYKETADVVEPAIQAVIDSHYNMNQVILVIAYEQRGGESTEELVNLLASKYGQHFKDVITSCHPWPSPGEVAGKGGNITYAGRNFKKYLEAKKIDPNRVIVTTLDADNRPDKQYLAALSYTFCSTEEPKHVSYQPIPMYFNNIWDAPAPMRIIAAGTSFWYIVLSLRQHIARNFSSHAQPMEALIETDFWSVRSIVEDGHQYWRTYFRYDGRHEVYPIYVPIFQDAVLGASFTKTVRAQFVQVQRWAWGASDIAYVAYQGFMKPNRVPKLNLTAKFVMLVEEHVSWATMPLILLFAANVPWLLHRHNFVANQLPQVVSRLGAVALVGILVTFYLSFRSLPPRPERYKKRRTLWMALQWIYLIPATIIFGALPALNSQTRLIFGWYLTKFNPTVKTVIKH